MGTTGDARAVRAPADADALPHVEAIVRATLAREAATMLLSPTQQ